jgi:hypothetical protein
MDVRYDVDGDEAEAVCGLNLSLISSVVSGLGVALSAVAGCTVAGLEGTSSGVDGPAISFASSGAAPVAAGLALGVDGRWGIALRDRCLPSWSSRSSVTSEVVWEVLDEDALEESTLAIILFLPGEEGGL